MSAQLSNKWVALTLAGLAVVLSLTTWFSATAVLPDLQIVLGLDASGAAWLTNAVQAGFVLGALVSSVLALSDVLPLTRLMAVASLAAAAFNAVALLDPGAGWVIAARFATGASLALVYPPSLKFIATWFRKGRGFAMGVMVGALTLGSALPHLVRGVGVGFDWQAVLVVSSLASLVAAAIFGLVLREGPDPFVRAAVDLRQIGKVIRDRPVMLANAGYFGHTWEVYAMWAWILVYIGAAQEAGLAVTNASILAFAAIAFGAPGSVLGGLVADRIGRCKTTAIALGLSGVSAVLIGVSFDGPVWIFTVVALFWGMTVAADSAQFSAAVTELADQNHVGAALAFQMGVGFAITIVTIWMMPLIAEALGSWRWSFLVLVPGPVLGSWAMLTLRRMPEAAKIAGGRR
ncbi:MFS transporter [Primorskyibacter flagellatus]|uniref:Sugar phosphate permease n=1 Tax=Primorskyibacter flagellatus TaxID=1387277 RepID=A0A1W1Z3W0_9RHOB|nr:MFS transporter [Primorskyibacter flagellatus]SMC43135.1 Sugar phosphate permease [Primorskyibacter flagellatus]